MPSFNAPSGKKKSPHNQIPSMRDIMHLSNKRVLWFLNMHYGYIKLI